MRDVGGPLRKHELKFFVNTTSHEEMEQLLQVISTIRITADWENQSLQTINNNGPESIPEFVPERKGSEKQVRVRRKVTPEYPAIAKVARVQGMIVLEGRITTDGKIASIYVLYGHPLLLQSAIDSVSQWEYEPFKRDGVPLPGQ